MRSKNIVIVLVFMLLLVSSGAKAQYLYDIGVGGGIPGYSGELSRHPYTIIKPVYSAFFRTNLNQRFALRLEADYGKLYGESTDVNSRYPLPVTTDGYETIEGFTTQFFTADLLFEVNFFPYPERRGVLGSANITPILFVGIGTIDYNPVASSNASSIGDEGTRGGLGIAVPMGVAGRWRFTEKWGLHLQFKANKIFTDALDGTAFSDPFNLSGGVNTTDWLYSTTLKLTYSFGKNSWHCNCPGSFGKNTDELLDIE